MSSSNQNGSIILRDIESVAEMRAVEDLQIAVWGDDERDIVPLNQFAAARHLGGTLIGAFDDEKIVGFVYGFYGHLHGHIVHHSHMLGVLPAYRRHNLAFKLKLAQREQVLRDGLTDRITWTFDPLQSLNAHFNFAKLGVVSDTYKVNVYGEAGASFLHRNGTDRFLVTWLIDSERVKDRIAGAPADPGRLSNAVTLITNSESGMPETAANEDDLSTAERLSVEIPADINSVESADFETARKWRQETRSAFTRALASGFVVTEYFLRNERTGSYLLENRQAREIP